MGMVEYRNVAINNQQDLLDEIFSFAADNGWDTWPSDGVIGRASDNCFVRIWAESGDTRIIPGRGYPGSGTVLDEQAPHYSRILNNSTIWNVPFSYQGAVHLFAHEDPHCIYVIFNYSTDAYQWLCFGSLEKYVPFDGGAFAHGSFTINLHSSGANINETNVTTGQYVQALFVGARFSTISQGASRLYANLGDGEPTFWRNNSGWSSFSPYCRWSWRSSPHLTGLVAGRSVNEWNAQTVFMPVWCYASRPDGFWSLLGHCPGIRHVNMANFSREQEITVGEKTYKMFPWFQRRTDGVGTGTWGSALEMPEA